MLKGKQLPIAFLKRFGLELYLSWKRKAFIDFGKTGGKIYMGRCSYSNRLTTNKCKSISTSFLNKHHFFDGGGVRSGLIWWGRNEEKAEKINFVVSTVEGQEFFRIQYKERIFFTQNRINPLQFRGAALVVCLPIFRWSICLQS